MRDRVIGVEIVPGDYSDIRVVEGKIFYLRRTVADEAAEDDGDGGGENRKFHLCVYNVEERKETVLGDVKFGKDGKFYSQDLDTWNSAQKWGLSAKLINEPVEPPAKYFTTDYLAD